MIDSSMILLVDAGNTSLKIYQSGHDPHRIAEIPTAIDCAEGVRRCIDLCGSPAKILVSSVKGVGDDIIAAWALQKKITLLYMRHNIAIPLESEYETPDTLGVDRHAMALALKYGWGNDGTVISVGTTITVDVLAHGIHQGGSIAPGLELLSQSLHTGTGALPDVGQSITDSISFKKPSTKQSIYSGCRGMVSSYITSQIKVARARGPLVISGGGGEEYAQKHQVEYCANLVARGMWVAMLDSGKII